jgi:uncharacterized protein (TIGR03382 family)
MSAPRAPSSILSVLLHATVVVTCATGCNGRDLAPSIDVTATSSSSSSVVYGADGRLDVYDVPPNGPPAFAVNAAAAFIDFSSLSVEGDGDTVQIVAASLGQSYGLCDDERFVEQPIASWCSGTLIDDDLVLTAGHCIEGSSCGDFAIVFDYLYRTPDESFDISISEDVYICTEVVAFALDGEFDHAIVRLDRPVSQTHAPVPVASSLAPVEAGSSVTLIGTPSGLPVKVDTGGDVVDPREGTLDYFTATVDAFGGNSGSGVYDAEGTVVGVLVRGEEDYEFAPPGCFRVSTLADDGSEGAEQVVYAARSVLELCESGASSTLCDVEPGVCQTCGAGVQCPGDLSCLSWSENPGATFCAPPCAGGCPFGHACSVAGVCLPNRAPGCVNGDVWDTDTCGNAIVKLTECGALVCENATCQSPQSGDTCATAIPISTTSQVLTGSLEGAANDGGGSCGVSGPDRIYTFSVDTPLQLVATATGFDTLLHLRRVCDDPATEIACDDDGGEGTDARIDVVLESGEYALFMDAWSDNVSNYTLSLTFTNGCGDNCTPGETVCAGAFATRTCSIDATGCPSLESPVNCEPGTLCTAGVCESTCGPPCPEGDTRCASDSVVETCALVQGCLVYVPENCPFSTGCDDGTCVSLCPDDMCTSGDRICGDDESVLECQTNAIGCRAFTTIGSCPDGTTCTDGACLGTCIDACTIGEQRCDGLTGAQSCIENLGGCGEWGDVVACEPGRICQDGTCGAACTNTCTPGESRCANAHAAQSCVALSTDCTAWSAPFYCFGDDGCVDGACVDVTSDAGVSDAGLAGPVPRAKPDRVRVAPISGCTSVTGAEAFWPLALSLLAIGRRRVGKLRTEDHAS